MYVKTGLQPKEKIQKGTPERCLSYRRHSYRKRTAVRGKKGQSAGRLVWHYVKMRIETGNTVSIRIARRWIFVVLSCYVKRSKSCHHNTMLEQFVFVARSSLAYPDMMCAISEREIFLKLRFLLQVFHSRTEFSFIARKKNRIHDSEINLRRFIAIETKAVFDNYVHTTVFNLTVLRPEHWSL